MTLPVNCRFPSTFSSFAGWLSSWDITGSDCSKGSPCSGALSMSGEGEVSSVKGIK